jgi:hypothetical protein
LLAGSARGFGIRHRRNRQQVNGFHAGILAALVLFILDQALS